MKKYMSVWEWNEIVFETYGKPYDFQCQNQGDSDYGSAEEFSLPHKDHYKSFDYEGTIQDVIDTEEPGVSLDSWLNCIPTSFKEEFFIKNIYPEIHILAHDMYNRGVLKKGNYVIGFD